MDDYLKEGGDGGTLVHLGEEQEMPQHEQGNVKERWTDSVHVP